MVKSSMRQLLEQSYNGDEVIEYIESLERELDKSDRINDKYKKALDKACSKLKLLDCSKATKDDWKEWCLKDE